MAYLTFDAGRGSQEGLSMAAAELAQRMAALGQSSGGASILARRDPRAAVAFEQMKMQAAQAEADRMQRGDLASQEMAYRNRALDTQGQQATADRQAAMERLMASLAGQRGLQGERLTAEQSMADAARKAAMAEAAASREFTRGQNAENRTFQAGEGRLGREHQTGLAAMQAAIQSAQQAAEQQGLDARARMDLQGRVMSQFAEAAASQDPAAWATVQQRIPEILAGIASSTGQKGYAPPPKPEPKTAGAKMAIDEPALYAEWSGKVGGQNGAERKPAADFVMSIPESDITANKEAFKQFMESTYGEPIGDLLHSGGIDLFSTKRPAKINRIRSTYGLSPTESTVLRRMSPITNFLDAFGYTPQ